MADWRAVLTGEVSDPGPSIKETGQALDTILQARPQADREVLEIISKRLGTEIGAKTMEGVRTALSSYAGEDPALFLLWVTQADQKARLAQVEANAPPRVTALLRAILGLYGSEMALAYARWNELPDDWTKIDREIYHDLLSERLLVRLKINKQNGEVAVIEGPAYSLLELTANMVKTCHMVGRADVFPQRGIDMLFGEMQEFFNLVRPVTGETVPPITGETAAPSAQH